VVLVNPHWATSLLMNGAARFRRNWLVPLGTAAVPVVATIVKRFSMPSMMLGQLSRKSLVMIAVTIFFIILFIALGVYDGIAMQTSSSQRSIQPAGQQS